MSQMGFENFNRVAEKIGGGAALRLFSFFSPVSASVYIPEQANEGHILQKLLGRRDFVKLVAAFRGETLPISRLHTQPLTLAAKIWSLDSKNVSRLAISGLLGVTTARVGQIIAQLKTDGFGDLEDMILSGEIENV